MKDNSHVHIAFAPLMVAGLRTQWENMCPYILARPDIHAHVVEIHSYKAGGLVERLSVVPPVVKGNVRSMLCASALFRPQRLDALWINDIRSALPFMMSKGLWQHTTIFFATDGTSPQQAAFGALYPNKVSSQSLRGRARDALDTFCLNRATRLVPWSEWAAHSLRDDYGIPAQKIQVIPPGINLAKWPALDRYRPQDDAVHLLFVGGDFERKGGDLLLEVFSQHLRNRCELHLVTRSDIPAQPGVHVYRNFSPNDLGLRELYAYCDIFVLPTRADCFSLASMEAMATGLPVITSAIGGIPEIIDDGHSGFLIAPDDGAALAQRIEMLANSPELRASIGTQGRRVVEAHFDAARNTERMLDLIVATCQRREIASARASAD